MMSYIDVNWDFSQFDRDNSARHHAAGYAKIAQPDRHSPVSRAERSPPPTRNLAGADGVRDAPVRDRADPGAARVRGRAAAAAIADVAVNVVQPSTWTVIGPVKNGNGPNSKVAKGKGDKDLEEKANVKRMFSP